MILLDTDALIEILQKDSQRGEQVLNLIEEHGDPATTTLCLHELLYGLHKRGVDIPEILHNLRALPFTRTDSLLSAQLEHRAEQRGQTTHRIDSMNAAIAINNSAKYLTFNTRHYQTYTLDGLELVEVRA